MAFAAKWRKAVGKKAGAGAGGDSQAGAVRKRFTKIAPAKPSSTGRATCAGAEVSADEAAQRAAPRMRFARRAVASPQEQSAFYFGSRPSLKRGRERERRLIRSGVRESVQPYVDTARYLYWGPSTLGEHSGNGVFARRRFAKGEIVEIAPIIIDTDRHWEAAVTAEERHLAKREQREEKLVAVAHDYYTMEYAPVPGRRPKRSALVLGFGSVYNHSSTPNLEVIWGAMQSAIFRATRDILPHEELFISYGDKYWEDSEIKEL